MALLGNAAVAMWWDMAAALRTEFEHWHSHEHFPERLRIPGFRRGSRWVDAANGDGCFVLYELDAYETLTSPHYLARLNDPTPWSIKMMPHHRNMVRSQCRIAESFGGGVAGAMLTLRLSPHPDQADALRRQLRRILGELSTRQGVTGGHLLRTHTPEAMQTVEQRIRGGADSVADWIILVSGYDDRALLELVSGELDSKALVEAGARPEQTLSLYKLSFALTPNDL
jgi:hypothetical protein